jgi:hypothetical protein
MRKKVKNPGPTFQALILKYRGGVCRHAANGIMEWWKKWNVGYQKRMIF